MARRFSTSWAEALMHLRRDDWGADVYPRVPTLPWITPPVPKPVREAFRSAGRRISLKAGEAIFHSSFVSEFLLIESGLTGRFLSPSSETSETGILALATPGRFACGNLNFLTRRPTIGRYVALSDVEVTTLVHAEAEQLLEAHPELSRPLFTHFEVTNLSDRMAFGAMTLLPAIARYQCLLLVWGAYYGRLEGGRLTMPVPGRNAHIERVIGVSSVTLDKVRSEMQVSAGLERTDDDFITVDAAAMQGVHDWMRRTDGENPLYTRPYAVEDFLTLMGAADRPDFSSGTCSTDVRSTT